MMAGWDTADDQWINESSEVEGCVEDLLCDANGDSVVDMLDFIIMSQEWGMTGENLLSDCNGDNTVEFADYIILSTEWGESECNW